MSIIARFEVIPVENEHMSTAIAEALRTLDRFDVAYETTPTDAVIEADSVAEVFAAVRTAHEAIPGDRVITSLEVDEDRTRQQHMRERVAAVERELGRPARQPRHQPGGRQASTGRQAPGVPPGGTVQTNDAPRRQPRPQPNPR
jgi:uncharacterized protein YqgV (UPF0045/DUF77 family)